MGEKSYIVPFLCNEELDRMVAIRNITTETKEGTLFFEEFDADVKPIKVLDQVWITMTNVPWVLRACRFGQWVPVLGLLRSRRRRRTLVEDALDLACNKLIDEICCKAMMEPAHVPLDAPYSPPTTEEVATFQALVCSSKNLSTIAVPVSGVQGSTSLAAMSSQPSTEDATIQEFSLAAAVDATWRPCR
jgi:hypothetical protein